jgi:crotonobetainyl-CoA:carnitine CoA-transferase CaiB-like acyl-CoA transferase
MNLPLEGVRVLDLTRALAGPFCTMILADMGADVVKVEPSGDGEMIRGWGPFSQGISVYYLSVNRNKRSLAVDMRSDEGKALLRRLALESDVVVENFRPGTMERLGLGWEDLRAANPRLVLTSVTGFGSSGPYGPWPGFDQIAQGMSGMMSLTGTPETGPMRYGVPIGDLVASMWAAIGTLAAIVQCKGTGRGQRVETSLLSGLVALLCVQGQRYLSLDELPPQVGNEHPVICPYGAYRAADGPINVAAATPQMWRSLCDLLGMPEIADQPDFAENSARMRNRDRLRVMIEERLAGATRLEWTGRFIAAGIPAGPIYDLSEVFADPQVRHCNMVEEVIHPVIGPLAQLAGAARLDGHAEGMVRRPPPMLGEHSQEILTDYGLPAKEIARLVDAGTVSQWDGVEADA